jgi:hypothetical protein
MKQEFELWLTRAEDEKHTGRVIPVYEEYGEQGDKASSILDLGITWR